ncbi:type II and III secretion system protein family protein [Ramlibacter sp. AN1015]|uniref:type II and III secretion system protein family protein n=1 Tax=Ramlibacter sp. AN1015 TaxID=3133428 RepID=UPI0030BE08C1
MHHFRRKPALQAALVATAMSSALFADHAASQTQQQQQGRTRPAATASRPAVQTPATAPAPQVQDNLPRLACTSVTTADPLTMELGKSRVVQLPAPAIRLIGGGRASSSVASTGAAPQEAAGGGQAARGAGGQRGSASDGVAETEITLLSPNELLILGRRPGSANVIVQDREGRCVVRDIIITADPGTLQAKLRELMPRENNVRVAAAENSIILTGDVTDTATLDQVMSVAAAYGDDKRIVNLMRVSAPQQVMLEVKIAEVSKTLLDRFGLDFARAVSSGGRTNIIQGIIGGSPAALGRFGPNASNGNFLGAATVGISPPTNAAAAALVQNATRGASLLGIDVENRDGIFRVLAEPNIMAISGQAASFLSGGKIFIPVAQNTTAGATTITLEEKEFGVGLRFTPTVLDGRINLKVTSEVSELSQAGTPFTTVAGVTAVLPSMTTRRVDTTVQLADGQSFAVAGLIRTNVAEALNKFPGLGEAPVIGALFRSTEFQNDLTELMFVITPRLVKPLAGPITVPTDNHVVPSRAEVILNGAAEGRHPPPPPTHPLPVSTPAMPTPPGQPNVPVNRGTLEGPAPAPARPMSDAPMASDLVVASATPPGRYPTAVPLPPFAMDRGGEHPHFD